MQLVDENNAVDYLKSAGVLGAGIDATCRLLAWGVSNVVLRISPDSGDEFVLKQSREQLRTRADWFSRLDRIWREVEVMQVLEKILPPGVVPRVLFEDRENYLFTMQAVEADHRVWKEMLLDGTVDVGIAETLGGILGTIHRETADDPDLKARFADTEVFRQLRIDPFYNRVSQVHADLAEPLQAAVDAMATNAVCLVHADFSPKNILVTRRGISLVDFETGHYGDPAFDLGFFLSHLLLKTVLHAGRCDEYLGLATTFWTHYVAALGDLTGAGPFDPQRLGRRTIAHLAGCMLARIDGKSTIDYLTRVEQHDLVRGYCRRLLLDPPNTLALAFERLERALR